jgi:hypothetical protein
MTLVQRNRNDSDNDKETKEDYMRVVLCNAFNALIAAISLDLVRFLSLLSLPFIC